MSRFPSFNRAPSETRRILRDRFDRNLRVGRQARFLRPDAIVTPDHLTLRLLAGLQVSSNADWSAAAGAYSTAGPTEFEPRDLEALADLGWLRRIWGRARIGLDLRVAVLRAPASQLNALKILISGIHGQHCEANVAIRADAELADHLKIIEAGSNDTIAITSQTPAWVAARLWETALVEDGDTDIALRRWVDWQHMLQDPLFVPGIVWSASDAQAFRDAATRVIATESALSGWHETRARYVQWAALTHNVDSANAESWFPPAPDTLVDRALWIESPSLERSVCDSLDICGDLFSLARLLLADADAEDHSPAPHPLATQILDLAIDRAELFIDLLFQVRARPRLLADLVIHPATAALACLLIAQWRSHVGAWDRELVEANDKLSQAEAFTDAVAILGENLRANRTGANEAAALLSWLHRRADRGFIGDVAGVDLEMAAFRRELANCDCAILLAMAQSLDGPDLRRGVGTPEFAAVLDLTDLGGIEEQVDAGVIVSAYTGSIAMGSYSLSAHRIGIAGAAALARIAGRTEALRSRFLYPFDVHSRLAAATSEDNEFILMDSLARALRAHIRVLCRAIIGGSSDTPNDLLEALVAAIRTGALQHREKGRIAAFAPRFENQIGTPTLDRPLAADLAGALAYIDHTRQPALLEVILETDEPLILAQLVSRTSPNLRAEVERRLAALAPTNAGAIQSLPEMQARIDELLTAGAADAAASYMEAEVALRTLGRTEGRELARFQYQLRLEFLRKNWVAITGTPEPSFPNPLEQTAAIEALRQFRGLAALKGPNPSPAMAKAIFADLFAQRPSLGFAVNWFAAEISELLPADSFGLLEREQIRKGRKAIAEVERMTALLPAPSGDETLACNQAMLLLALGEPGEALALLSAVSFVRLQDTAAAYRAVALSRMGRGLEATAALDTAERNVGRTAVLTAARTHVASGALFLTTPYVSLHDDLVANVASAIARFRTMNPTDQAWVLQRQADPFEALLVEYVRAAADAVVSLVPMMKGVQIDAIEDDLTAFIQHLLAARVQFLGWSVSDQSKGGFSAKGNAGERDLVINWGSSVLALIEAVICDEPLTRDAMKADLESHFQKLLGYGNPRVFFHLTYAYGQEMLGIMRLLEMLAERSAPPGFTYLGREPIPHDDSRPPGFVARYSADFGEVKVVFLVLNLGQQRQQQASRTASATKSRRAPKGPKISGMATSSS